eukprot:6206921-Pleurochrysis_carterae.AAC.3
MREALSRWGFFYLADHGIAEELISDQLMQRQRVLVQARALFDLPADVKLSMPFDAELDVGYLGSGGQALDESSGEGDTKEGRELNFAYGTHGSVGKNYI